LQTKKKKDDDEMSDGTLSALSKAFRPYLPGEALGKQILEDLNISPARKFRMLRQ
jgi:hypothetical protein